MKQYLDLMRDIRENGVYKEDRTGTGTYSVFGRQMRFNLQEGFPLVTTKKLHLRSIIHELLWFLKGETNIRYLKENGVNIWDEWVKKGTEEYRELTLKERSELTSKRGGEVFDKWLDHIRALRGDFFEGMIPLTPTIIDEHHKFLDTLGIPRRVLIAGELGPVYGAQWRSWPDCVKVDHALDERCYDDMIKAGYTCDAWPAEESYAFYKRTIDQIAKVIETLKTNPDSRRIIVSAWNPALVDEMALPPCHALFQFYSAPMTLKQRIALAVGNYEKWGGDFHMWADGDFDGIEKHNDDAAITTWLDEHGVPSRKLSCQLYQRSADVFLGVPFNIASYALLVMMVAQVTNHVPDEFIWTGGDTHLYSNHLEQADLQLTREPLPLPVMKLNPEVKDLFDFKFEDFTLEGYESHPHIAAPVAV